MADLILQGVDVASVGICVTDPDTGRFLYVNDMISRLLGRGRDELLGLTILDVMRPEDHAGVRAAQVAMVNGELGTHHAERKAIRARTAQACG